MKLFFIFSSPSAFLSRIPAAQDMQKFILLFCQPALPRIPHQLRRVRPESSSRDFSHDENEYSPARKSDNLPSPGLRDEQWRAEHESVFTSLCPALFSQCNSKYRSKDYPLRHDGHVRIFACTGKIRDNSFCHPGSVLLHIYIKEVP